MGSFPFGVYLVICSTVIHHLQILINLRDWNVVYIPIVAFSIAWLPICLVIQNFKEEAVLHRSIGYVLSQPLMWLMIFLAIGVSSLPLYFHSRKWQLIDKPKFYVSKNNEKQT